MIHATSQPTHPSHSHPWLAHLSLWPAVWGVEAWDIGLAGVIVLLEVKGLLQGALY